MREEEKHSPACWQPKIIRITGAHLCSLTVLREVALELLLSHADSAEALARVSRGLRHVLVQLRVRELLLHSLAGRLHNHATRRLVLYLGYQVATILHILHYQVVV